MVEGCEVTASPVISSELMPPPLTVISSAEYWVGAQRVLEAPKSMK